MRERNFESSKIELTPSEKLMSNFEKIKRGELLPWSVKPSELFAMASELAISGDYQAKLWLFEHCILPHPDSTETDKLRVNVYQFDLLRRGGQPEEALNALEQISLPNDQAVQAEYHQAVGQCHLMLKNMNQALASQRRLLDLGRQHPEKLPPAQRLYHIESFMAMKLGVNQADEEFAEAITDYKRLLSDSTITGPTRNRAEGHLACTQGRAAELTHNFTSAAEGFISWFDLSPANRDKAVAALEFLAAVDAGGLTPQRYEELAIFFREHHVLLLPTDISALQEKYDRVTHKLGLR